MYNFTVMHRNEPVAQVWISDDHMNVRIEKIVPDSLIQSFGGDDLWIKFDGEELEWENVRWRK